MKKIFLIFNFTFLIFNCLYSYDYVSEKLHYGNIFYPPGDFDEGRRHPVLVNDTVREYLKDSETEFNLFSNDENKFYEKSAGILYLSAVGFSDPSDFAQIYLKKKKYAEQDFAANSVFFLLNTEKIFVADDEIVVDTHLHTIYSHDSVADKKVNNPR